MYSILRKYYCNSKLGEALENFSISDGVGIVRPSISKVESINVKASLQNSQKTLDIPPILRYSRLVL